jgi:phospholipid-binding lipoprotein MlaA
VFDYFLGPLVYLDVPWETQWGMRGLDIVHSRAELLPLDETLQKTYDPYAFIRDAWAQQREFAIFDGNPPPEQLEDFEDDPEESGVETQPATKPAETPSQ